MTTVHHAVTAHHTSALAKKRAAKKAAAKKAAAKKAAAVKAAAAAKAAAALKQQQTLGMSPTGLLPGMTSPLDGTSALGTALGFGAGQNPGATAHVPQVNATNQSALAPNGDINQSVTNNNNYENRYYNIISMPQSSAWGGFGLLGNLGLGQQSYVDPQTGVLYTRQDTGVIGWFKRLLRGY